PLSVVNGHGTWSKITQFRQLVVELQPSKFESLESLFHPNPPSVIVKHYLNAHKHSDNINEKEKTQSLPIDLTHTPLNQRVAGSSPKRLISFQSLSGGQSAAAFAL